MDHPTIYFIRHGQTDWNKVGRLQGRRDIPLNDHGRSQAKRNGVALKAHLPNLELPFIASPMARTRETMEIVRDIAGLPVEGYTTDNRLKEISFGDFEGHTAVEIEAAFPDLAAKRAQDKFNFAPPHGESYAMVCDRVRAVLADITEDSVIVSHGGISRAFRAVLFGLAESEVVNLPTPQDQIMKMTGGRLVLV